MNCDFLVVRHPCHRFFQLRALALAQDTADRGTSITHWHCPKSTLTWRKGTNDRALATRRWYWHKAPGHWHKAKGKGMSKTGSKGKSKGKSKKDFAELLQARKRECACYACGGDHFERDCPDRD